jgi:Beta-propeller repeat
MFEPNVGQAGLDAEFIGRGTGVTLLLTGDSIAFNVVNHNPGGAPTSPAENTITLRTRWASDSGTSSEIDSENALSASHGTHHRRGRRRSGRSRKKMWDGEQPLAGRSNYFLGNDHSEWRTNVPEFAQVVAKGWIRGVDMTVYSDAAKDGQNGQLEYDLRLAPSTDASKLRLQFSGAETIKMDARGDLALELHGAELRMKKPDAFEVPIERGAAQPRSPPRNGRSVQAEYVVEQDGTVGFRVAAHDSKAALVIDPAISVTYASFLGGPGTEQIANIARDTSGNIYVGGTTTAPFGPVGMATGRVGSLAGSPVFFVAKINPNVLGAASLIYLTFLGGSGKQSGGMVAVDGSGDVAIAGTTTSADFPVTDGSLPTIAMTSGDGNDVAISEIAPSGAGLIFASLFGGSGAEAQNAPGSVAFDPSGDIYIAMDTNTTAADRNSPDLPVTQNAWQTTWDSEPSDGFFAIFTPPPQGSSQSPGVPILEYCTYLGINSAGAVGVEGIAVDSSGDAYIAGYESSSVLAFPATNGFQSAYGGGTSDAFLMKIAPGGQSTADLIYGTLIGGSGMDEALAVAVDAAVPPNAYVVGTTQSPNFPVNGLNAPYQATLRANLAVTGSSTVGANAFLAVVSQDPTPSTTFLSYSTYLGGSATDAANGVAVAALNQVYIAGTTSSWDFPWHDNLQAFNGTGDAFVAKFDPTMAGAPSLIYATPLGGTSPTGGAVSASASGVVTDGAGDAYVAGQTTAADFPTAVTTESSINGFQQTCASCGQSPPVADGFVAAITESSGQLPSVYFNSASVNFPAVSVTEPAVPQLVAVFNAGEAALVISGIEITGPNARDFSVTGQQPCIGPGITPGPPQCSFEVGFSPSAAGPESAVVQVTDNAPGSPQLLQIVGAGQGPVAMVNPTVLNFGNQPENSVSNSQTIVVTNAGNENLTISNVTGLNTAQFRLEAPVQGPGTCQSPSTVTPGGTCVITVAFAPSAAGVFSTQLNIFDNSGGTGTQAEQTITITGTGTETAAVANVIPASLSFGTVATGASAGMQAVTLTNLGSASLNVSSITLAGVNAGDFSIVSTGTTCPTGGGTVVVAGTCQVGVQFSPLIAGPRNAVVNFADNAAGTPQQVALSGTAVAAPNLQVAPTSLTFAAQSAGTASAPQTVTILNIGGLSAGVTGITITGTNPRDFILGNSCAPSLAAGGSCQLSVSFSPQATGGLSRTATLNIASANVASVSLAGTVTQASISLSPANNINFGNQVEGTLSSAGTSITLTATNTSSGPAAGTLAFNGVSVTGPNQGDFVVTTDNCYPGSTVPGANCSIVIAFAPACVNTSATRSATLTLNDNAQPSPQTLVLSGTATGDFCFAPVVPQSVAAGAQATYTMELFSADNFTGAIALACSGAPAGGACTVASSVTVGQQFTVDVATGASATSMLAPARFDGPPNLGMPPGDDERGEDEWRAGWLLGWAMIVIWVLVALKPGIRQGRYLPRALTLSFVLMAAIAVMVACSAQNAGVTSDASLTATPSGAYAITVTATAGSDTQTAQLSLTVQ